MSKTPQLAILYILSFFITMFLRSGEEFQDLERRSSGNLLLVFYCFFSCKHRRWAILCEKYASGLGPTNLQKVLRFNFFYEKARYQRFLPVVSDCFTKLVTEML